MARTRKSVIPATSTTPKASRAAVQSGKKSGGKARKPSANGGGSAPEQSSVSVYPNVRWKGATIQDLLDEETIEVPWVMRQEEFAYLGSEDIPIDRYTSQEYFDLEVEKLWPRVWQFACWEQDIPEVGSTTVYDLIDWSFIITRVSETEIKGYYNSCLHRGRQLRTKDGYCAEFRCPFHGLTWNLDGSLKTIPESIAWDFGHVDPASFGLPEVRVETHDGMVFINMDHDAPPLLDFLGDYTRHFERWPFKNRWKAAHVAKVIEANWKATQDAFLESFHVIATHPQMNAGLLGGDGSMCEYDIYGGGEANFNRMILAPPMPNPNLPYEVSESELVQEMYFRGGTQTEGGYDASGDTPDIPEGMTARAFMAQRSREMGMGFAADGSQLTDTEVGSAIQYFIFPNLFPWSGPIFYRFRPYGRSVDKAIMEVWFMITLPPGVEPPAPPAKLTWLAADDDWTKATELGALAEIFNQDSGNIPYLQKGMKAAGRPGLTLANYGDSRIRHYHHLLDKYIDS
jgi:nitrite reductase/ring-hydroxylating ferredoxin subunit